jgi:hypothetical protein
MEDLSRNLEKVVKAHTPPKPSKRAGSWSVLLLEDHGRMVLLGKLKRLMIPLALVLIIATVSFAWLLIVFKSTREDNKNLSNALDISRQKIMSFRDEKDLLMVRLVVAESKIKNKGPDMSLDTDPSVETGADSEKVDKTASLPNKKQVEEKTAFARPEKLKKTAIEDFIVSFEPDTAALNVQFRIINTSQNAQPVSGHAFVILKQSEVDQKSWLIFPPVPLVSGKPTLFKKGQYFSILRFKTMKFEMRDATDPKRFKTSTIFVFATTGELLMEKSFPVEITETVSNRT